MIFFIFVLTLITNCTPLKNKDTTDVDKAIEVIAKKNNALSKLQVSEAEQLAEIESLSEVILYEKFFFVVDVINQKIVHPQGIKKWLGYDEKNFSLKAYFECIHPSQLPFLIELANATYKITTELDYPFSFREQQYVVDIALKHHHGNYILCKRSLSPWQWQAHGKKHFLTHYLLEFTITNHHIENLNTDLSPRIYDRNGNKLANYEKLIKEECSKAIENRNKIFSPQELRILRKFAYNQDIKSEEIAESFKITKETVHTLNRRIMKKGKYFMTENNFKHTKELAMCLRRNYWI